MSQTAKNVPVCRVPPPWLRYDYTVSVAQSRLEAATSGAAKQVTNTLFAVAQLSFAIRNF